ncbi:MAG TPA: single-stranded DNA-binding protein [Pyrinomonadaceae bacterium]|nr:single-stranded DNA-binding protein [Pyrinomonadaceae bacterium]
MSANISILGNAGRDATLKYSEKGTAVASFPIASNSYKNGPEGRMQVTHWFNVVAFGKTAETLAEHVKKGTHLLVHGRLSFSPWSTDKGEPRSGAEVSLFSFEFVGANRSDNQEGSAASGDNSEPDVPEYTGTADADATVNESPIDQF